MWGTGDQDLHHLRRRRQAVARRRRGRGPRPAIIGRLGAACLPRILALLAILAPAALEAGGADAHDWYPYACCSDNDCRPIEASEVAPTPGGWLVKRTGEVIAYDSTKLHMTPREAKGAFHRCSAGGRPEGKTICLYVPDMGS